MYEGTSDGNAVSNEADGAAFAVGALKGETMNRTLCIAFTAIVALTGPASAADLNRDGLKDEGSYMPAISWAGFYAGGHVGVTLADELEFTAKDESAELDIDEALIAGVHVGYNWQTPSRWVYGIEADLDIIDDQLEADGSQFDVTEYLATVRGRIGVAMGHSLLYTTAGVALLAFDDDVANQLDDTAFGFVAGAGFEHKLSRNFSLGVEGLYYRLATDFEADGQNVDLDRDFWTVRARATYHFDRGYAEALK